MWYSFKCWKHILRSPESLSNEVTTNLNGNFVISKTRSFICSITANEACISQFQLIISIYCLLNVWLSEKGVYRKKTFLKFTPRYWFDSTQHILICIPMCFNTQLISLLIKQLMKILFKLFIKVLIRDTIVET